MPLSEPSASGGGGGGAGTFNIGNGSVLALNKMYNTGTDTSISFQCGIWDYINNRVIVGGDGGYVGSKALITDKLIAASSIASNTVAAMALDQQGGGVFLLSTTGVTQRTDSNLANFVTVTPAVAITEISIFSLLNDNNIYLTMSELAAPQRNIAVSADQGATWDSNPGLYAPISGAPLLAVTSFDGTLVAITSATNGQVAITADPVNGPWVTLTTPVTNAIQSAAFSDDNSVFVCSNTTGRVFYALAPFTSGAMIEIPGNVNPFYQTSTIGQTIDAIMYSPLVSGFVAFDSGTPVVGYIPKTNPALMEQGALFGDVITSPTTNRIPSVLTDSVGNLQFLGTVNDTAWLVPPVV